MWVRQGEGGPGHSVKLRRGEEVHVYSAWESEGEMQVLGHV